jgi:hypothetical protein
LMPNRRDDCRRLPRFRFAALRLGSPAGPR